MTGTELTLTEKTNKLMKTFYVNIPLNARVVVQIDAENQEEAIKKALLENDLSITCKSEKGYDIEEWDCYDKMLEGNYWHGIIYRAEAEEDEFGNQ